jgi:hypothetical protein
MKQTITQRTEKAKKKALPLISKHYKMSADELLKYMRENPEQYKKEKNIINRYYNLEIRDNGYVTTTQYKKENKSVVPTNAS